MTSTAGVRVGGVWLRTLAAWGDLTVKHGRNGPLEASWSMALPTSRRPSPLVRNARVEIFSGPFLVWSGTLVEPDWDSMTFTALGNSRELEGAECLTAAGAVTSKVNTALDQAKARGAISLVREGDFGNTDLAGPEGSAGVSDPEPGKLNELLNLWAVENNSQWRTTPDGRVTIAPEDEASPRWLILPGVGTLGVADDDITDRVFLRYFDSAATQYRTASYPATTPAGGVERRASITHLGPMTSARATSIAQGMYNKAQAGRTGWTNGVEAAAGQIITRGGLDANLALIRAGHTVRLLDAVDPRGVSRHTDVVLAETEWRPSDETIQLNPVGLAARTWEQVMEEANARGDR